MDSGLYKKKHGTIGVRVNPQVGTGSIVQMSTAGKQSKFGLGLEDLGDSLLHAIRARPWITAVHCHVGSQGCPLELIGTGVRRIVDMALQANKDAGKQQIKTLNIGGGLPVNFKSEEISPTFNEYAAMLRQHVPELFSGQFRVFTEFGRSIAAKAGFFLARVEYTKISGGKHYATVQAGADLCVRTVYMYDLHIFAFSDALLGPTSGHFA
jgi:diaminopimelate decarboxylase